MSRDVMFDTNAISNERKIGTRFEFAALPRESLADRSTKSASMFLTLVQRTLPCLMTITVPLPL